MSVIWTQVLICYEFGIRLVRIRSPVIDIDQGRLLSERSNLDAADLSLAAFDPLRQQPHEEKDEEQDNADRKESDDDEPIAPFRSNDRFTSVALRCFL